MTSREIIHAVLAFDHPPRTGMTLPAPYPQDMLFCGRDGTAKVPLAAQGNEVSRWRDEWGVTWASLTDFDKGEVVAGAVEDWSDLDGYTAPDLGLA